jgi:small subunit ribosomal protein S4
VAKYIGPVCRLCRREGTPLFLKGPRCFSEKCAIKRREYPPGQHGTRRARGRGSDYGAQLREKQKARRIYGILEAQFRNYFSKASRMRGITGENLLQLLERRLDNVAYRMGCALSRAQARQLVRHGHFTVNGRRVDIPSYLVKPGDLVQLIPASREVPNIQLAWNLAESSRPAPWILRTGEEFAIRFDRLPTVQEIGVPVKENLIVELYSR